MSKIMEYSVLAFSLTKKIIHVWKDPRVFTFKVISDLY